MQKLSNLSRAKTLSIFIVASLMFSQLLFGPKTFGQTSHQTNAPSSATRPNGISVGRPKVYDNRALTLMLESLSETLRNTQVIDQKSLAAAFANQQGFQSTDFTSNLAITTAPTPATSTKSVLNTGNVSSTGAALPNTTQTTNTRDSASVSAQAPPLDAAQTLTGYTPNYGESSSDLLNDQTNLQYQIFNLRMLLERSLSDRLLHQDARLQSVLGFNVTLDPPRTTNDAVAVVEITLNATGPDEADDLSLVSLMPQEKTYNSAALSTKSNAFAGSAVVKMVQVGYSQRRSSKIFYLYRDTDTIAYERMLDSQPHKLVFGWMFRPVLGRRSVSPGIRQLFAIVALPNADKPGIASQTIDAHIRTYWKKYDARTATSFLPSDANRATRASYLFSLGLKRPELFTRDYDNKADFRAIEIRPTSTYEANLRAQVTAATWRPTGSKSVLISVSGRNFFTGTQVTLGDKVFASPIDGLVLKSNETFDLATTLDSLVSGPGTISGRYGSATTMIGDAIGNLPPNGIEIESASLGPSLGGFRQLQLHLHARNYRLANGKLTTSLTKAELPLDAVTSITATPIVSANGHALDLPYTILDEKESDGTPYVLLQATVPSDSIPDSGALFQASWPFLPRDAWTLHYREVAPSSFYSVTRLTDKTIFIATTDRLGFVLDPTKNDLKPVPPFCWQLLTDDVPIKLSSNVCSSGKGNRISDYALTLTLEKVIPDKVILIAPYSTTFALNIPKLTPEKPEATPPITLRQFDSQWVDITGKDFRGITTVEANQLSLKYRFPEPTKTAKPNDPIKAIQVEITRDLTARPGTIDITVFGKDNKQLATAKVQISCILTCASGGKNE